MSRKKLGAQNSAFGQTASALAMLDGRLMGTSALNNDCMMRAVVAGVVALSDPASTAAALPLAGQIYRAGRWICADDCYQGIVGSQSHGQTGTTVREVRLFVCLDCLCSAMSHEMAPSA